MGIQFDRTGINSFTRRLNYTVWVSSLTDLESVTLLHTNNNVFNCFVESSQTGEQPYSEIST